MELWERTVHMFGLTNAPSTFQRFMNNIFVDMIEKKQVIVCLDDVSIVGDDVLSHNQILREMLAGLSQEGLIVRLDKCTSEIETFIF